MFEYGKINTRDCVGSPPGYRGKRMNYLCEITAQCPYCGEPVPAVVDTSQGDHSTIEDCTVCCRPIQFDVQCEPGEVIQFSVSAA